MQLRNRALGEANVDGQADMDEDEVDLHERIDGIRGQDDHTRVRGGASSPGEYGMTMNAFLLVENFCNFFLS